MDFPSQANALLMSRMEPEPPNAAEVMALVERAASGDAAAFEQIVVRNERRVLTLAYRLLGNMEDAQDAAQEVFFRVFKYLHRFDARKPFEPWLVRIAVNVCRDFGAKRRRLPQEAENVEFADPSNPHSELAREQQMTMLRAALGSLPEKERMALVLRDLEGMSTAEVADALGSSEATVRVQISSARIKLKKVIHRMKEGRR